MGDGLVEFLTVRLDEREQRIRNFLAFRDRLRDDDENADGGWEFWGEFGKSASSLFEPNEWLWDVEAKRRIVKAESQAPEFRWQSDVGGDYTLSGDGYFANYWPDNTVSASIYPSGVEDGERLADTGIVKRDTMAACQTFAEQWIREHLAESRLVLRLLALPYADHSDYKEEWNPHK